MSVSFSCNRHFHQRALQLQQPLPELTLPSEMSSELCVVYFVAHSSDDSDSLLDFLFAQEFYYGVCVGGQRNGLSHNNGVTLVSDQKEWKCIKGAHLTGTDIYQSGDKSSTSKDIR